MGWSTWDYNQFLIRKGQQFTSPGGPAVSQFFKSLRSDKWPKFPSPFPWISDVRVLACEKDLLIEIENIASIAGQWVFSTFVPQPSEIVRKFLTGKTKKGYFGLPLEFAPLDILWTSGDATKILATITAPLAEGLYFLWLQQTAVTALQSAQMVGMLFEACPDSSDETLVADGLADTFTGSGSGGLPLWTTIQDPHGRYNSPGANMTTKGHWCNMSIHGYVHSASEDISSMKVQFTKQGVMFAELDMGHLTPGTITPFSLSGSTACNPTDLVANNFIKVVASHGVAGAQYIGTRWTMNSNPANPHNSNPLYPHAPDSCYAPNQPFLKVV